MVIDFMIVTVEGNNKQNMTFLGSQPKRSVGGRPEGVLDDVPPLRQGQDRSSRPRRLQVVSQGPRLRPADGGAGRTGARV